MLVSYLYLQVCANKASGNVFLSTPLSSQTRSLPSVCLTSALFQSFQHSHYLLHLVFAFSLSLASGPSFLSIFCRVSSLSQHLLPSLHYVNILRFKSPIRRYLLFQSSARYLCLHSIGIFSLYSHPWPSLSSSFNTSNVIVQQPSPLLLVQTPSPMLLSVFNNRRRAVLLKWPRNFSQWFPLPPL